MYNLPPETENMATPLQICLGEEEQGRGAFTLRLKAMPGSAPKPGPHCGQLAFRHPPLWQTPGSGLWETAPLAAA